MLPGPAPAATPTVTEFSGGLSADSRPFGIAAGPEGNLWFTDEVGRIGRITPSGTVTEFSAGISANSWPRGIAAGPDGNLWFTEHLGNRIGRITPSGTVTEFGGLSLGSFPSAIAVGPDGNLWFTESSGNRVGRITPSGAVTEFSAGISANSHPNGIAAGPDGNLWFTESDGDRVGRITPSGTVTEFSAGISPGSGPHAIAAGPDGNLWFTEYDSHRVGRITPSGTVTEFGGLSAGSFPSAIAAGPDGNLWVTEFAGNRIARITPSGTVTEFGSGISGSGLQGVAAGPDGHLWFTEFFDSRIGRITTALDPPAHTNPAPISVPGAGTSGPANPYPSPLAVAGLQGTVTDVTVRLTGISHSFPDDIDALLVGPQGQEALLVSDAGGSNPPAHGVTLNLRDSGPFALPNAAPLVSGVFRPTDLPPLDSLPAPAPGGPYGTTLSVFDGTNPNGAWQLFLRDDAGGDVGSLHRGWGLDIATTGPPASGAAPTSPPTARSSPAAFGRRTKVSVALDRKRSGKRKVVVRIRNRNAFKVSAWLRGHTVMALGAVTRAKRVMLSTRRVEVSGRGRKLVTLKLHRRAQAALERRRRLTLAFTARVRDPAGNKRTLKRRFTHKLKRHMRQGAHRRS